MKGFRKSGVALVSFKSIVVMLLLLSLSGLTACDQADQAIEKAKETADQTIGKAKETVGSVIGSTDTSGDKGKGEDEESAEGKDDEKSKKE
ncbi:MAG: hypothetical protein Q7U88_15475 [Desulfocapsaceae bacterium]|nr:hypothetical protein [Desulfocapsaceae bacterium]